MIGINIYGVYIFRLAVDLNDYDLFMDIHHAANRLKERRQTVPNTGKNDAGIDGLNDLAQAALIKVSAYWTSHQS